MRSYNRLRNGCGAAHLISNTSQCYDEDDDALTVTHIHTVLRSDEHEEPVSLVQ